MIISSPSSRTSLVTKKSLRITPTPVVLIKMPFPLPFSTTSASPVTIWTLAFWQLLPWSLGLFSKSLRGRPSSKISPEYIYIIV
ncbi:hypothetical protein ACP8HZ_11055 [Francisella noatunensis]